MFKITLEFDFKTIPSKGQDVAKRLVVYDAVGEIFRPVKAIVINPIGPHDGMSVVEVVFHDVVHAREWAAGSWGTDDVLSGGAGAVW